MTILGLITGIIVARQLGPEIRGYFGLVVMASLLIASLGHLGIGSATTYFTGKKKYEEKNILALLVLSALVLGSLLALILYLVYPMISNIWTDIPKPIMIIGLSAAPFMLFNNYFVRILLAQLKVRQSNIANLLRNSAYLVLVVILLWKYGGGLREAVICFSASTIIAGLLGFLLFTPGMKGSWRIDRSMIGPFYSYGFRAYLLLVFNFINYRIDIFLIKHFLTASDVSYYSIAVNIAERLWYLPNAMGALLFPTLMAMNGGTSKFTAKVCRNNFFIMFVISVLLLLFGKFFIVLLYGKEYLQVIYALYSILWGISIITVYRFLSVDFASKNRLGISVAASITGIALNIAANIYMIPRYGVVGAGISTSFSYTVLTAILSTVYVRERDVSLRDLLIPRMAELREYPAGILSQIKHLKRKGPE